MSIPINAFVSVIIPTYNRSYCVWKAIDSVRNQTHSNWEVVVVDDGSTDDTHSVIRSRYGADVRIRYIYQTNAGVSAARNTGIRASRGNYIAFLDSDDIWKPWKLNVQLGCFRAFPEIGMAWTNFEAVNPAGDVVKSRYLTTMYEAYRFFDSFDSLFEKSCDLADLMDLTSDQDPNARVYVGNIYTQMLRGNLVHTSTVLLSKERIEKVGWFDVDLTLSGEDYDYHFRTCKWGAVAFVDIASMFYQLGFSDRLTQYSMQIAQNFLKTVTAAIERERGTATFSGGMVDEVLAEAHAWVAEELFKSGDYAPARRHALRALHHRKLQPRLFLVFALTMLPSSMTRGLLKGYRSCKHLLFPDTKTRPNMKPIRLP
jgi:glycosyltransferase involved in cell wall biosynthesis